MDNNILNILITDVSHPVTASAIETLRSTGHLYNIVGIDHSISQYAVGELWVDHHYTVPSLSDDTEGYVSSALQICKRHNINVIVPWTNEEAIIFAKHAPAFLEIGTRILTSNIDAIDRVVDKYFLMNGLKEKGFVTPNFYAVNTIPELNSAVEALGYPSKSVVVKPRNLSGARGFCLLDPRPNISKRGFSDSLPFPAFLELIKHLPPKQQTALDLIAMEFLSGEDYSVDILANNSKAIAVIPRLRLQTAGGVSSMGETTYNPLVSSIAASVVEKFGLDLNVNVQMRYRKGHVGTPFVYDVNPRISGTIAANDRAGINFIHEGIRMAIGNRPTFSRKPAYKHVLMVRRWKEDYIDFAEEFPAVTNEKKHD